MKKGFVIDNDQSVIAPPVNVIERLEVPGGEVGPISVGPRKLGPRGYSGTLPQPSAFNVGPQSNSIGGSVRQ
jgi:hypothetical protein